jgi:hypothetical protein
MNLKFRNKIDSTTFDNLMEKDGNVAYELSCLASNIKKEVIQVLDSFLSLLKKYEERKPHNMFSLMLDPIFETLYLVSPFIGLEQGKAIVEKYDKKSLFPMLLICYYHLHPFVDSEKGVVDERVEEDMNLDIFEMITNTSEPTTELVNRELMIFRHYKLNVEDIRCPLHWWEKHGNMFPIVGFCVRQILGIIGSQIEIEIIFSLPRILTSIRKCHLQLENLDKLIFVSKN